jgi:hypothetical protein
MMNKPTRKSPAPRRAAPRQPVATQRPDLTVRTLFAVAELALDEFFEDPPHRATYAKWLAEAGAQNKRGATVEPFVLGAWKLEGDGTIGLIPLPRANQFALVMQHPKFNASVSASYDLEDGAFSDPAVMRFDGNRKVARETAQAWLDEVADDEDDETDEQGLRALLDSLERAEKKGNAHEADFGPDPHLGDQANAPPPATREDADHVQTLARTLAKQIGRNLPNDLDPLEQLWLKQTPQTLFPILDALLTAFNAPTRDLHLIQALEFLLVINLEQIRYRLERGWDWAARMLDEYQQRVIQIAREETIDQQDWFRLAAALSHAKVPVKPEVSEALAEAGMATDVPQDAQLESARGMIDNLASTVDRPFDVVAEFSELAAVLPTAVRSFMAHELARSKHEILRDAVPLMLLDADAEVRRATAGALEQIADAETLSPDSLRRIIAVRNWIPEADRPMVDSAIRKARSKGVECAQWPQIGDLGIMASPIDGSGAQTVMTTGLSGRTAALAGVLIKLGFGIRDAWCDPSLPRRELNAINRTITQQIGGGAVERAYLDIVVQHAIAVGLAQGHVPSPVLLDVAEHVRAVDWQDRRLDIPAEAERLFQALDAAQRTPQAITESLRRSGRWMKGDAIAMSWYEDGAKVRAIIDRAPARDKAAAAGMLLTEAMPETRPVWAELFLLMALEASLSKAPALRGRRADLAILSHELCGERPLAEIPVMRGIANQSVVAAHSGAW